MIAFYFKDDRGRTRAKLLRLPDVQFGILASSDGEYEFAKIRDGDLVITGQFYDCDCDEEDASSALDELEREVKGREFSERFAEFLKTNPSPTQSAAFATSLANELGLDLDTLAEAEEEMRQQPDLPLVAE